MSSLQYLPAQRRCAVLHDALALLRAVPQRSALSVVDAASWKAVGQPLRDVLDGYELAAVAAVGDSGAEFVAGSVKLSGAEQGGQVQGFGVCGTAPALVTSPGAQHASFVHCDLVSAPGARLAGRHQLPPASRSLQMTRPAGGPASAARPPRPPRCASTRAPPRPPRCACSTAAQQQAWWHATRRTTAACTRIWSL